MGIIPAAIIFINNDLVEQVKLHIIKQLHISEVIDGYIFDDRVTTNSSYAEEVRTANLRLMVIRPFTELENREEADVAIFVKNGLASVLKNNFGPPGVTFPLLNLHWQQLGVFTT